MTYLSVGGEECLDHFLQEIKGISYSSLLSKSNSYALCSVRFAILCLINSIIPGKIDMNIITRITIEK